MVKKIEGLRCALTGDFWHREAGGRLTRSRASCVIGWVYIWLSLVVLKLEAGIKIRKLSIIDPVFAILD